MLNRRVEQFIVSRRHPQHPSGKAAKHKNYLFTIEALRCCRLLTKLRVNPFSVANAEQEIYTGVTTEFDGPRLALWELAHGLEWVALTGLWVAFAVAPANVSRPLRAVAFVVASLVLALVVAAVAAATARLKLTQAARVYWQWGFAVALVALVVAMVWP